MVISVGMPEKPPAVSDESAYKKLKRKEDARPLSSVLEEHDLFSSQREARIRLLKKIERLTGKDSATIGFISSGVFSGSIDSGDITAFGDVLMSVGDVNILNLIIDSPGGDGSTAEKLIELCRAYCAKLRVIIPNRAKSAATIIALGADEIVMGHCSEIGPIDAQVPIVVGGIPRYISAQSFIDAKDTLEQEFADRLKANPKADVRDLLQQLASLDVTFIDHCKKLMEFCKDVARKNLEKHMFAEIKKAKNRNAAIEKVIQGLAQPSQFQIHARMIDGNTAKTKLGLNVKQLAKDDDLWKTVWNYYIRADVFLSGRHGTPGSKMVESREESLFSGVVG